MKPSKGFLSRILSNTTTYNTRIVPKTLEHDDWNMTTGAATAGSQVRIFRDFVLGWGLMCGVKTKDKAPTSEALSRKQALTKDTVQNRLSERRRDKREEGIAYVVLSGDLLWCISLLSVVQTVARGSKRVWNSDSYPG